MCWRLYWMDRTSRYITRLYPWIKYPEKALFKKEGKTVFHSTVILSWGLLILVNNSHKKQKDSSVLARYYQHSHPSWCVKKRENLQIQYLMQLQGKTEEKTPSPGPGVTFRHKHNFRGSKFPQRRNYACCSTGSWCSTFHPRADKNAQGRKAAQTWQHPLGTSWCLWAASSGRWVGMPSLIGYGKRNAEAFS